MPLDTALPAGTMIATLNYLRRASEGQAQERPRSLAYAPDDDAPRTDIVNDARTVPIRDIRGLPQDFSLDREGFAYVADHSAVADFWDEDQFRTIWYREAEHLLKEVTGATRVHIFDHTLRRRIPGQPDDRAGVRQPAARVHVDHTARSGPQRVRDLLPDEADRLLRGRVQVINLWRPVNHPVYDAPLAVADAASVSADDLVPSDLIYRYRIGETYSVSYNRAHRWYYLKEQRSEEVLLLKCYDSRADVARFAPHSAFLVPDAPADAPTRESIELRTFVFHDA